MIDFTSQHIGYVAASYGIAALVFMGLVVWAIRRAHALRRDLAARGLADIGEKAET